MKDFICELCNKKFTTKYGLQKHKNNVICNEKDKKKPIFQCSLCEKILSSKQNLKSHEIMCKLKKVEDKLIKQTNNFTKIINNDNLLEDNLIEDNLIQDNLLENNLNNANLIENDLIEDNLIVDKNLAINNIMIPIQDYNFFKCKIDYLTDENKKLNSRLNKLDNERQKLDNENQKLKDEIIKLNNIVSEINTNTNNINIYNIQINIISFMDNKMSLPQILEVFLCKTSPLYDMAKVFNYERFHYPIAKNGLNRLQKYQEAQIKKMVYNDRKMIIKNANLGFCYILDKYFENPSYKNLRYVKATILEYYNGTKWLPTTVYSSKRILVYNIIDAIDNRPKLNLISGIDRAMDFLVNDYHKNYEEYLCCDNDEFINMIKRIHI
jgi:hypothetical protein